MQNANHSLHFPLALDRSRGRLQHEEDYPRYVNQLIRQVLLTAPGQRAHRPDFGTGLRNMLFAPNDENSASLLRGMVLQQLQEWLGTLIDVDDVQVRAEGSTLRLDVIYTLKARSGQQTFNLEVTL